MILDDHAPTTAPGQMRRAEFLASLEQAVFSAAEPGLSRVGRTARDCPFLAYMFEFYRARDTEHLRRAVLRHTPETRCATSADEYLALVSDRARRAVDVWVSTGRIEWQAPESRASADPRQVQAELGPGQPLEASLRSKVEPLLQEDFSRVRVHTDAPATSLSGRLQARAVTVGQEIAFGPGEYQPGTPMGDAVIAHELAHVVQQRAAVHQQPHAGETPSLERDANQVAGKTVMSIWTGNQPTGRIKPALRTGLSLQSCKAEKPPQRPNANSGPLSFKSSEFTMDTEGPVTIVDQGDSVGSSSSEVLASGRVTALGGADTELSNWRAGFVQTVLEAKHVAEYVDASGAHNNALVTELPGPTRDGRPGNEPPWYASKPRKSNGPIPATSGSISRFSPAYWSVQPFMTDQPGVPSPWKTPDGTGTLQNLSGEYRFGSWLVVRQDSDPPEKVLFQNHAVWSVDWTGTADFASRRTTSNANGTKVERTGPLKGPKEPVLVGPVACESVIVTWEKGGRVAGDFCKQ